MAKPSSYWDKRAVRRLTDAEKQGEAYSKQIQKMYDRANKNIQRDIENIYHNYSKATGLDVQSLKQLLTKTETDKLWGELRAKGLDKYVKGNYKARISRLEKLQAQIYAKVKEIYPEEQKAHTECYNGIINDSYYKAIYDTQMGTGFDFAFANLDDNLVSALLNERWSGLNYSQRIWGNTDLLAQSVSEIIGGALLSGQSIAKTSRQIRERFDVGKYYADRLVRTEANHFHNEADAMAYEEMDVDKYVFLAVLDTRTSKKCQEMDNEVIELKDRQVGKNYPPLHPNCRSTTRAYMGEEIEKTLKRRARNPVTGKNEVIDNMSYKEWAKKNGLDKLQAQKPTKPKANVLKKQPKDAIIKDKPKFVPAKTIEEAQQYAGKFADRVSFAGLTNLENANAVNETLERLTTKYPTKKLKLLSTNGRLKSAGARACYNELEINPKHFNGKTENYDWAKRVERNKQILQEYNEKYLGNPKYNQKHIKKFMRKLEKENKFVRYDVGAGVRETITHEYGHIIADQYLGMINGARANPLYSIDGDNKLYKMEQRITGAFFKARNTGDIYKISFYADTDVDEFFAEAFTMYDKGEELPDYITQMVEEVLNFGKL